MQHTRDRLRELTDRRWLLLPVEVVVRKVNAFLRGWAGYFRYGNSARHLNAIRNYALGRLALFIAKRHTRTRAYGWSVVAFQSPDNLGLIDLKGSSSLHGHAGRGGRSRMPAVRASVSRVRENRTDGSRWRGEETGPVGWLTARLRRLPPTLQ
jgi:Group II intron, maturase-specific domain